MTIAADTMYVRTQPNAIGLPLRMPADRRAGPTSSRSNGGDDIVRHHDEIVGDSPALRKTLKRVEAVATTPATVLILGESGVGKELIARAVHRLSPRRKRRLVKVNCASIPNDLFESEFFGHVKGSFTGAHRDRTGRFDLADGGTLFLDEVTEIPLDLQAKLLRVLQEGQFERIGDEKTRSVDVRIVAATNRDLHQAVVDGRFRADLYYRLSVFPVNVPPLRERTEDIVPLARHFLELTCVNFGIALPSLDLRHVGTVLSYDWPGNIRELRNLIERAVILSDGGPLDIVGAMPAQFENGSTLTPARSGSELQSRFIKEAEWQQSYRDNIVAALDATNWRISGADGAAELLGINASTLRGRMKSLAIRMPRDPN